MPDKGIVVEIYRDSAPFDLVDVINARMSPTSLSELKAHGAGSFSVSKRDPKLVADPTLLEYRNFVRVRLNGVVVGGFIIQTKKTIIVGAGEAADEVWQVSGEGLRSWSNDAKVFPAGGLKPNSKETRFFNFASEQGSWYVPGEWTNAVNIAKWRAEPNWWITAPAQWPDAPDAYWIWDRSGPYAMPLGYVYFRHEFTTTGPAQPYSLFFAVDDRAEVYVDGELLMTTAEHAWMETSRLDFDLSEGNHVIAFKAYNFQSTTPGALIAALYKVGDASSPTSATLVSTTGNSTWKIRPYPAEEPGWTPGDIILTLLEEAEGRGVRFAANITPTFTTTVDSSGVAWKKSPWSFGVGTPYSEVFSALEEVSCDIYLDPDTLQLHAWVKRGTDRSLTGSQENPVVFSPGKNLVAADETGQADITNTLLLHTPNGWQLKTPTEGTSISKYGVVENQMSTELSEADSQSLTQELFRQKALPEKTATFQIVPFPGATPFLDFQVGDYVSAPGEAPGSMETRRVMSISLSEDQAGNPVFALEFDTIFKDRQSELEKWVSRATNSSAIGGGFTNSGTLPSTVIVGTPAREIINTPDAPTGLAAASVGRWSNGAPLSDLSLTWNPVISSGETVITDVESYQVWGRTSGQEDLALLTTVFDSFAFLPGYEAGKTWHFAVRAISRTSGDGRMSEEISHTTTVPNLPLGKPSTPSLSSSLGTVTFQWDGLLAGEPAPNHLSYILVQRKLGAGAWEFISSMVAESGVDATAVVGQTYDYRFIPVDYLGIQGTPSDPASVTVLGIGTVDIDGVIMDAIEEAQENAEAALTAANGKNKIVWSTSDASSPSSYVEGDLWYKYSGNEIVSIWKLASGAWVPQTMTSSTLSNVNAGVLTAGTINSARIGANSISTSKLLITSTENLALDSSFEYNSAEAWTLTSPATNAAVAPRTGARALSVPTSASAYTAATHVPSFAVEEGERYRISGWVRLDSGVSAGAGIALSFLYGATQAAVTTASADIVTTPVGTGTTYVFISGVWTVPTGAKFAKPRVVSRDTATGKTYRFDDITVFKMASGELIVDGTVTAAKIASGTITANEIAAGTITGDLIEAGAIQVNHISPEAGASLDISANGSINFIVGRQNVVEDNLSSVNESVDGLTSTVNDVQAGVSGAQNAAADAAAAAAAAQGAANTVRDDLTALGNVYRFTPTAAIIGNPGTNSEVRISSTEIGIYVASSKVSWWNAGQFNATSLVAIEAQIGNHKIEKFGNRTLFRKV